MGSCDVVATTDQECLQKLGQMIISQWEEIPVSIVPKWN